MPTDYTGNRTATQAPASTPGFGVSPVVRLPNDLEDLNVASVYQDFKVLADYVDFLIKRGIFSGFLGDKANGNVTTNVTTTAGGNVWYNNLTIQSSGLLVFDTPHLIRVMGKLDIASGGKIRFGHATNMNGANGTPGVNNGAGAGGIGWNSLSTGYLGGGGNGGAGGDDVTTLDGVAGQALGTARMGGAGGAGGTGGTGSDGGAAGSSTAFTTTVGALTNVELLQAILNGGRARIRTAGTPPTTSEVLLMGGSPGGGGGAESSLATPPRLGGGGGGGAGGCVGIVIANEVVIAADGALFAPGGNGGAASDSNTGGGGGGGGGWIALVCNTYSGPSLTAAACCPGGSAGAGGANPGTAGATGRIDVIQIGY